MCSAQGGALKLFCRAAATPASARKIPAGKTGGSKCCWESSASGVLGSGCLILIRFLPAKPSPQSSTARSLPTIDLKSSLELVAEAQKRVPLLSGSRHGYGYCMS